MTVPVPTVTLHAPALAQSSVTPRSFERPTVLSQEYAPASNVMVAPSSAPSTADWTSLTVLPWGQLHACPFPAQAASAREIHPSRAAGTTATASMVFMLAAY